MHLRLYSIAIPLWLPYMCIMLVEGTNPDIVRDCYSRALRAVVEMGLDVHDCVEYTKGLELLALSFLGMVEVIFLTVDGGGCGWQLKMFRVWVFATGLTWK